MKLFAGLSRTDYQDVFRAIGAMLDERCLLDVRIWEYADGIVVQGRKAREGEYETIMYSDDDLRILLEDSYERRNQPKSEADPGSQAPHSTPS